MPSKRVHDILDHIRSVHHQVSKLCEQLGQHEPDSRLQLLLAYIARHEERFNIVLKRYEKDAAKQGVLETWLQFSSDETLDAAFRELDLHAGMTAEEIVQEVLSLDTKLVALYRQIADSTSSAKVQQLFADLVQMEEGQEHKYARLLQEWE